MTLSRWQLFRIAFRSLFLQASWNYRGMMSMGFLYSIAPGLDYIYPDGPEREMAYMRHFEYFNTNPYFSSVVMGVTLTLEERLQDGDKSVTPETIHNAKDALMTSLAAIGDGFFWDSWRPFVAVLSIVFASGHYMLTPFIFLLLYNIPHLYLRFVGIYWGYNDGMNVIKKLKQFQFPQIRQTMRIGTLVLLAYLIPNNVTIETSFLSDVMSLRYLVFGKKVVQGLGALAFVALGICAYRNKLDVLLISFLLLIFALVLYHWEILI